MIRPRATVGDRLRVTGIQTARPGADPDAPPEVVDAVVTVRRVTRMICGCDRLTVDRPHSAAGPCPTVDLFAPGCPSITCGVDFIDVDAAREPDPATAAPDAS